MSAGIESFRASYASAFGDYLRDAGERTLRAAYELGRRAVGQELSVLDLAVVHHDVLLSKLGAGLDAEDAERTTRAAGEFFLESLSAFEMVQRGFREARETASLQRRHAEVLRRLSGFLADASLALDEPDSLEEMLRLVAEQARELTGADCGLATVALGGEPRVVDALSYPESNPRWQAFVEWADLSAIYRLVRSAGPLRLSRQELTRHLPFRALALKFRALAVTEAGDRSLHGWLSAPLTTLDGRQVGSIQLLHKHEGEGDFTELDEAVLLHLAQMASAAVERAWLYQREG